MPLAAAVAVARVRELHPNASVCTEATAFVVDLRRGGVGGGFDGCGSESFRPLRDAGLKPSLFGSVYRLGNWLKAQFDAQRKAATQ